MYCISKCCRLCLTKNNTLVNITWGSSDGVPFVDKLGLVAPSLGAKPRNFMTSWICEQCRKKLKNAYSFIQYCFKSDAVLDEYYMQLASDNTAQNKCTDSEVSNVQLTETMMPEFIPISIKDEYFEDLPATDDDQLQYHFESTITIDKHELSPGDFEIKSESSELNQEADCWNIGETSNNEIMVSEYDRDQVETVQQMDQITGTSGENNISFCSKVPIDVINHAGRCNINAGISLTKLENIKSRKPRKKHCIKCGICNKIFTQSGNLKQHEKLHSDKFTFKCAVCNAAFTRPRFLKEHEKIHSGDLKAFTQSRHLNIKLHKTERPYNCEICNKAFIQSGHLKEHKKIHTGERPFKCDICNKAFIHSGNLRHHKRVHTGERPFKCNICNKAFTQSGNLKEHEKVHSGERPFKCETCDKTFTQSVHLKIHQKVHTVTAVRNII